MTTIHMETEKVQTIARNMDTTGSAMLTSLHQIQSATARLNYAWRGGEADDFNNDLNNLIKKLEHQVTNLQNLSVRVAREADEWSSSDTFGQGGGSRSISNPTLTGSTIFGGATVVTAATSAALAEQTTHKPSWLEEHFVWGVDGGWNGSRLSKTGKQNWHRSKPDLGVEAKAGIGGAVEEGKYHSWGKWEAGAKVGVNKKGKWDAGLYAEGSVFEAHGTKVFGSSAFGFTPTAAMAVGSAEAFAGMKDNRVGASIGGSLVSGELGLGLNIFGYNISLSGGLGLGLEAGFKIGAKTEGKLGPFKLGISFGKAITE